VGSLAPAHHQDRSPPWILRADDLLEAAVRRESLTIRCRSSKGPLLSRVEHLLAHRISGNLETSGKGEGCLRVARANGIDKRGQQGIGPSGNDVLLQEDRGEAGLACREDARHGSIASKAKGYIKAVLQESPDFPGCSQNLQGVTKPAEDVASGGTDP